MNILALIALILFVLLFGSLFLIIPLRFIDDLKKYKTLKKENTK